MEVLTGVEAGERKEDCTYPEETINFLVDSHLKNMADFYKDFYSEKTNERKNN